ncbi:MAG TPA: hypothetical protein VFW02_08985 [Candidatus Limnocylindrales bacterium]|nr:hypothetical protein [Candidatus Limnocylindrales bacterium]
MKRQPRRSFAVALIGALLAGLSLAPSVLAVETDQKAGGHIAIQAFGGLAPFSDASHKTQTITFDELATGTLLGNPASLGPVNVAHASAATLGTLGSPFAPVSSPNVLAPFASDGALDVGDTTLTFPRNTHRVGFFLILPSGSNADTTWTSSVTATDTKGESVTVVVTFQGVVGEQQFIGFDSHHMLDSISFGPAVNADATSVLALDDIVVD